jgi:hypothetical protein
MNCQQNFLTLRSEEIRRSEIQLTGSIFSKIVQSFAYADDIDIVGNSLRAVNKAYSNLENDANRVGLLVNELKAKNMFTGQTYDS